MTGSRPISLREVSFSITSCAKSRKLSGDTPRIGGHFARA